MANAYEDQIVRKKVAKYSYKSRPIQQMSHSTFMDFTSFMTRQIDVDDLEETRKTMNSYFELKSNNSKTVQEKVKLYMSAMVSLLVFGVVVFLFICVVYAIWYQRTDHIKASMGFTLMALAFGAILIFAVFYVLYYMVIMEYKKIMLLL